MAETTSSYTRRGVLALGAAAVASGALRWLFPYHPRDDANDFPVSSYRPPGESVDLGAWRLEVAGAVADPLSLSYNDLLSLPHERHRYALTCVTGWMVVRDWEGVPITALLERARPLVEEATLRLTGLGGYWITLPPSRYKSPGALVVTRVAGVALSADHGFPARLMLPEGGGVDDIKWLSEIEVLEA